MAKLTPYFFSDNAREQAAFYMGALGGEIPGRPQARKRP